ncbi:hypothetical protein [Fictibacillus phosphorivorans]|uniref:hypothetical protein n=1 Tax=Fictibacillus phosphorivorans TaxID=1221500 RepID=UPI00129310BB|nr:hypothetical protein [Fictibacillus phosphorivorans]MQR96541.1 hypothetical protein [Fictibacillus phosphorivorans]
MINLLQFNQINGKPLIPARLSDEPLLIKLNQFISAKILEIFPDQTAKVQYNGSTLHAKLEAPLIKGENYLFEVSEKNGAIYLKKMDLDPIKSTSEQILSRWSLPASDLNKKAIDFAVIEKLPLLKENIKVISEILKYTNTLPLHEKKAVVQRMMELQLPPKQEIVQAVTFSLKKSTGSSDEFKQLYESLLPFIHKDKAVSKTIELIKDLFVFKGNESSKELAPTPDRMRNMNLKNTPEILMPSNGKLPEPIKVPLEINDGKENTPAFLKDGVLKVSKETNLNPSQEFITAAKKWLVKSGLLHEKNIILDPVQLKQTETLKSQLLFLQQNADRLELPEIIQQKTEQALNKLTGQQLQNLQSNENLQQFVLHIPFSQSENPKEMTVRWESKKQDGKGLDPDHCRMLFWLEMKHLKDIAVDVQIQNRIVSLKVFHSHPSSIEKLSEPLLNTLKYSMKNMNYTLSSVTFNSQTEKIKNTETSISYKGLDLRV